ncbi:MAG TPA: hypothetical protein DDW52_21810 [Planctomycetaceae bacterium]|nr:hypothetical protein [Planctomycetaceae bacterium]
MLDPKVEATRSTNTGFVAVLIVVAAVLGGASTYFFSSNMDTGAKFVIASLLIVAIAGSIGGLLFAIRESLLEMPRFDSAGLQLGCIADCGFGIAGAFVIFLVIPGMSESIPGMSYTPALRTVPSAVADLPAGESGTRTNDWLEVLAVALVGGYAGRALMQKATVSIAQVEQVQQDVQSISRQLEEHEAHLQTDQDFARIVRRHLDLEEKGYEQSSIVEAGKHTSYDAKARAFMLAKRLFAGAPEKYSDRTRSLLQALVELDASEQHAELRELLARCFGEIGQWDRAAHWIGLAIDIRGNTQNKRRFEVFRARCAIELCPDFVAGNESNATTRSSVYVDLCAAYPSDPSFKDCHDEKIQTWLKINADYVNITTPGNQ